MEKKPKRLIIRVLNFFTALANRFKGLELKLLDDHTWGVILEQWEFAQKECVKKLGEQVTLVAISGAETWAPTDWQELAEKCSKIRVLFLEKKLIFLQKENTYYWPESEIYSFFKTTRDILSAYLPDLKVVYLPKQLQANSLFYVCTKKESEQYCKSSIKEIPSFDTVFFDEKQPKANLADYPATAKELIDILLHITPSSKISSIDLTNCSHISASQLENLFSQYSFEEISLEGCSQVTDAILTAIQQKSSYKHKLRLIINKNDQETRELAAKHGIPVEFRNAKIQPTSCPMYKVDTKGFIHFTINYSSDDALIQAWDTLHKHNHWNRLASVEISAKSALAEKKKDGQNPLVHFIEKCTNIRRLKIDSFVDFDDDVLSVLPRACPHLTEVDLHLFHYTGNITTIANTLASFPSLVSLSLVSRVDDQTVESIIRTCPEIRSLYLGWSIITDASLEKIATCYPDLEKLDVTYCQNITDQGIARFAQKNSKLKTLSLKYCENILHETVLAILKNTNFKLDLNWSFSNMKENWCIFPPLQEISEKKITDELNYWPNQNAKKICIKGCEQITDNFITFICKNKPKIQALDLRGCHQVTDKGIQQLVTECDSIDSLLFANNANISDETVQSILENCPKLKCLVLEDCDTITYASLKHIKNYQPRLEHLSLAGCKKISSDGLRSLAKTCKKCEIIDLRNCSQLLGGAINTLVTASKKSITEVRLSGCTLLRDRELKSILAVCKQLKVLDIDGCSGISQEMRDSLFTNYPQLQKLPPAQDSSPPTKNDNSTGQSDNKKPGKMEENEG